jgi:hypothetical protein
MALVVVQLPSSPVAVTLQAVAALHPAVNNVAFSPLAGATLAEAVLTAAPLARLNALGTHT